MKNDKKFDLMNLTSWKNEFWSHEIRPPDHFPNSLTWMEKNKFHLYWLTFTIWQKSVLYVVKSVKFSVDQTTLRYYDWFATAKLKSHEFLITSRQRSQKKILSFKIFWPWVKFDDSLEMSDWLPWFGFKFVFKFDWIRVYILTCSDGM